MTTPADQLRAAAKVLRETAAQATPGPWRVVLRWRRSDPTVLAGAEFLKPGIAKGISLKYPDHLRDARWNALTNPALAEPLADLLDHIAAEQDREPCDGAPGVCNRCEMDPTVLLAELVASAICPPVDEAGEAR